MITTVQDRNYVVKETREGVQRDYHLIEIEDGVISESIQAETTGAEKNKLFPTNVAYLLVDFLVKNFSNIIGYEFTANLESDFDLIAEESKPWAGVIRDFYEPFHAQIELAKDISRDETHGKRDLGEDPVSGKPVSVRFGRYGAFAQIGHQDDEEKPTFSSLRTGQDIENITLAEAIELFKMPRTSASPRPSSPAQGQRLRGGRCRVEQAQPRRLQVRPWRQAHAHGLELLAAVVCAARGLPEPLFDVLNC